MSLTVQTVDKLLKVKYDDTLADQMGVGVSELYAQVDKNNKSTGGRELIQPIKLSLNGGVGFSNEIDLPGSATAHLDNFKVVTKNIYGVLAISLKALKANNTPEKIVNLLNNEMDDLVRSVRYHTARAMEGKSSGVLCTIGAAVTASASLTVDDTRLLEDGMVISIYTGSAKNCDVRIKSVDHSKKTLNLESAITAAKGDVITNINSLNQEFTGLGDIFSTTGNLYGLSKTDYPRLIPYMNTAAGAISDTMILSAINDCERRSGTKIDFINAAFDVISKYVEYKQKNSVNISTMDIEGGYKSLSFNGMIPIVKSRFAPDGTMDILDTSTFRMVTLGGKGGFVDEDGSILQRVPGKAEFVATYAKFSELYCNVPGGQGRISGITAAV